MRKSIFFLIISLAGLLLAQEPLQVGMKASDWEFPDADGKMYTMDSWKGKVLQVNYVDPDESELNEPFNEAVKKAIEVDSIISRDKFKGMGIVDTKSTWKPDFLIRAIAGRKAKKYNTTILFDYDAKLRKAWGLKEDSYNVIILDKNRVCRAIVRGKIPDDQIPKLVKLIQDLQNE